MLKKCFRVIAVSTALGLGALVVHGQAPLRGVLAPGDWPEIRGLARDGV